MDALRFLKKSRDNLPPEVIQQRQEAAYNVRLDWDNALPVGLGADFRQHAATLGIPPELLFVPFLTLVTGMMTPDTTIKVNEVWKEPPILWGLVAAKKGEKKSATMKKLVLALRHVEAYVIANTHTDADETDSEQEPTKIFLPNSQFTFPKLFTQMQSNNGSLTLIFDEVTALFEQLERHGENSKVLLSLYGGDDWCRSTKTYGNQTMEQTHLNYTGFMQPQLLVIMLHGVDVEGYNDRHWACLAPARDEVLYQQLETRPRNPLDLGQVLLYVYKAFHEAAKDSNHFVLDPDAQLIYEDFYNSTVLRITELGWNEDHCGVLAKAQGQCVRLALALHVTLWARAAVREGVMGDGPSKDVTEQTMHYAIGWMEHSIAHRFALMPEISALKMARTVAQHEDEDMPFKHEQLDKLLAYRHKIKRLMETAGTQMKPSTLTQKKLCPPILGKYNVKAVEIFCGELISVGLMERLIVNKRIVYRQKPIHELEEYMLQWMVTNDIIVDIALQDHPFEEDFQQPLLPLNRHQHLSTQQNNELENSPEPQPTTSGINRHIRFSTQVVEHLPVPDSSAASVISEELFTPSSTEEQRALLKRTSTNLRFKFKKNANQYKMQLPTQSANEDSDSDFL